MVNKICIDPGHGMSNRKSGLYDPGAVHTENGVKFEEATIALQYGLALRAELQARGKAVFMTRDDANDHAPVGQRAGNAKNVGCDMLISLHLNDFDDDSANGMEILYGNAANKGLADTLLAALLPVAGMKSHGNDLRPDLAVLKFNGPAVLIELGFIANDHDRERLLNPAVRSQICRTIADVITDSA